MLKKKGFTLIEMLVVAAIIVFLVVLLLPNYRTGRIKFALFRAAHTLAQDLRRTQEMAMSGQEIAACLGVSGYSYGFGLQFKENETDHYLLFADCNDNQSYDPGTDEPLEDISLERYITIHDLSQNILEITFVPPEPRAVIKPDKPGWIQLTNGSDTEIIRVNDVGLIFVE